MPGVGVGLFLYLKFVMAIFMSLFGTTPTPPPLAQNSEVCTHLYRYLCRACEGPIPVNVQYQGIYRFSHA